MWDKGVYPGVEGPWGSIGEGLGLGVLHADGDPGSDPRSRPAEWLRAMQDNAG